MHRRSILTAGGIVGLTALTGCSAIEDLADGVSGRSVEEVKNNAQRVPYDELYRNISEYENEPLYWPQAYIADVASGQETKEYILTLPSGDLADSHVLWGVWNGDPFRNGDDVEVWGVVEGLETYTALSGEQTVPKVNIRAMNLI